MTRKSPTPDGSENQRVVTVDPVAWSRSVDPGAAPSTLILGIPGQGKSSSTRPATTGYIDLIRKLGGQIIPLGKGRGGLNVLDPSEAHEVAAEASGSSSTLRGAE